MLILNKIACFRDRWDEVYMNITTTARSHLGLVSGTFDELGIANLIDTNIPKNRNRNLSHFAVIKAMCLNCFGFNEIRLYLYSDYFEKLPTERHFPTLQVFAHP